MENKGLRVNIGMTKIMVSSMNLEFGPTEESWKGSLLCLSYKDW